MRKSVLAARAEERQQLLVRAQAQQRRRQGERQGADGGGLAPDRATVDAFHAAALAAGGRDNGAPGLRPRYHGNYYGSYVLDPDGHNVEAVCHHPE